MKITKLKKLKSGGVNCLILRDGHRVDCTGAIHSQAAKMADTTLTELLSVGVCRTHWSRSAETFAIECGRQLTDGQKSAIRKILSEVGAHILITDIAGVYNVKESFGRKIRGV